MRMPISKPKSLLMLSSSLLTVALVATACLATDEPEAARAAEPGLVARVGDIEITRQQLEEDLAPQLLEVERQRQQILERGMVQAIEQALLDLEAEAQGVTKAALLEGIYADVKQPTDAEVDAFYESRKARINRPKEEVADQIVNFLRQQSQQALHADYIQGLRERYEVSTYLEPLRMSVAEGGGAAKGPTDAPVTIVEFSDFQCPYCQRLAPTLDRIKADYGDRVRLVFRQFPLPMHAQAPKAAEASLCAGEQGKFWEMHDKMFENIRALSVDELKSKASTLGLDADGFAECLDSGRYAEQVAQDLRDGRAAGVTGTPAIFINGRFLSGAVPYDQVAAVIDDELEREARKLAQ